MDDTTAASRARRLSFQRDLTEAYTDEEACPPEWADLLAEIERERERIGAFVAAEAEAFVREPDIRLALARRERAVSSARARVESVNAKAARLNLISPISRFQRSPMDVDAVLTPLFRAARPT